MPTAVATAAELTIPEFELVILEFDSWSNPKDCARAATCTICWAMPEFAETEH